MSSTNHGRTLLDKRNGGAWQKLRARVLKRDMNQCVQCGGTERLQVDHITPRWAGGDDSLANLQSLCKPCHDAKSAREARARRNRSAPDAFSGAAQYPGSPPPFPPLAPPEGRLTGLEAPGEPRHFPGPHPNRAGSKAASVEAYAASVWDIEFLDWQRRVLDRLLEHDEQGLWCWPQAIILVPRQSGKSTIARMLCEFMASDDLAVLSTSAKLMTVTQLMRASMNRWRNEEGYVVRAAKEQPEINWPHAGDNRGRWISQAANEMLGRGFTVDVALVDEVQDVAVEAMESLSPAMTEAPNPLTVCFGTAARGPSELLNRMRDDGLRGGGTLLIEWSAPMSLDYRAEETWRVASPRWSPERLRKIRSEVRMHAEPYIRSEYLCQPLVGGSEPWLNLAHWEQARRPLAEPDRPDVAVVEDGRGGEGAVVGLAWPDEDGVVCVTAFRVRDLAEAWRVAGSAGRVLCGVTLRNEEPARELRAQPVGAKETVTALPELRRLLPDQLRWDGDDLDEQVRSLDVRESDDVKITLAARSPSSLVRCAAWAVQALRNRKEPLLV